MRSPASLLLVAAALLLAPAAYAQKKGVPDVATTEARVTESQEKIAALKAANLAATRTIDSLKAQLKASEKLTKELQKQIAKQEGVQRVGKDKQKDAEIKLKTEMTAVKEAKKREKAGTTKGGK
jgi:septal ring factor EnvC (AmiA/AmiB activator)